MPNQSPPKHPKVQSARYPGYSLAKAIELAKAVDVLGGTAQLDVVGSAMSPKRSLDSGPGKRLVAAAGYYGLIERKGPQIKILDRGRKAFLAQGDDRRAALAEAFLLPKLFASLVHKFAGKDLPPKGALISLLQLEHHLTATAAPEAYDLFLESGLLAGVLTKKNGAYSCRDVTSALPPERPNEQYIHKPEEDQPEATLDRQTAPTSRFTIQINLDVAGWTPEKVVELIRLLQEPD